MIKAVLFDVGGVIIPYLDILIDNDIKRTLNLTNEQFAFAWESCVDELIIGKISEPQFWNNVICLTNCSKVFHSESLFLREYKKKLVVNKEILKLVLQLKQQNYKVAVLSNSILPHSSYNKRIGLYDPFDSIILSDEVGMMKPNPAIFIHALSKLGINPNESIFIDDKLENVDAANSIGIYGIQYFNYNQLINELGNLLKNETKRLAFP
ncbi:MAG: HAD family phosphatase [bacterium]|nr:HAD family phosphatase [bacterium]